MKRSRPQLLDSLASDTPSISRDDWRAIWGHSLSSDFLADSVYAGRDLNAITRNSFTPPKGSRMAPDEVLDRLQPYKDARDERGKVVKVPTVKKIAQNLVDLKDHFGPLDKARLKAWEKGLSNGRTPDLESMASLSVAGVDKLSKTGMTAEARKMAHVALDVSAHQQREKSRAKDMSHTKEKVAKVAER